MGPRAREHMLLAGPQTVHTGYFDSTLPPVLSIDSGDTVVLSTMMLMDGQLRCGMRLEDLLVLRQGYVDRGIGPHTLTGPIFIRGAEPGDVLEVRVKRLLLADGGVNYHLPGTLKAGSLPEEFPNGRIKTLQFDLEAMTASLAPGIRVPLRPFLGIMGVAPHPGERRPSGVPDYFGGNIDNKELVEGTTLYLPVNVRGALFSAGDAHATQGDGEVNVTAAETALREAALQFVVRKDMRLERPMAETSTHWITMGFHPDLDEAAKIALRDALAFLRSRGVSPDDAYALASLAVDLRVTQVVNGNRGIHAMIPKAVLAG